ncbi:hypothetical protein [Pedobacter psychrophilus]|uniref:hypothetical protein n=1 Tax=Pedobacter psychrophilus TaxID=1826909 RepID=UPI000ABC2981|nr:hypothetical protein [Pedobacter psychrophilus]
MRKTYYLFGMFLILLTHTLIMGWMLTNEGKEKANQANKISNDFFDKRNIKLYPVNRIYSDSSLKINRFTNKDFVIK